MTDNYKSVEDIPQHPNELPEMGIAFHHTESSFKDAINAISNHITVFSVF